MIIKTGVTEPEKQEGTEEKPLKPRETVAELDKYIIGQNEAKRAVAIALRNRWRRQQLSVFWNRKRRKS